MCMSQKSHSGILFLRHTFTNQNNVNTWEMGNNFLAVLPPLALNTSSKLLRTDSYNFGIN